MKSKKFDEYSKIIELKKQLEEIKKKANKNGWVTGKHIFNFLEEIEMHRYDVIFRRLNMLRHLDFILGELVSKRYDASKFVTVTFEKIDFDDFFVIFRDDFFSLLHNHAPELVSYSEEDLKLIKQHAPELITEGK